MCNWINSSQPEINLFLKSFFFSLLLDVDEIIANGSVHVLYIRNINLKIKISNVFKFLPSELSGSERSERDGTFCMGPG